MNAAAIPDVAGSTPQGADTVVEAIGIGIVAMPIAVGGFAGLGSPIAVDGRSRDARTGTRGEAALQDDSAGTGDRAVGAGQCGYGTELGKSQGASQESEQDGELSHGGILLSARKHTVFARNREDSKSVPPGTIKFLLFRARRGIRVPLNGAGRTLGKHREIQLPGRGRILDQLLAYSMEKRNSTLRHEG